MSIRDILRLCYDTDATELRMFGGFGSNCTNVVRFSYDLQKMYWKIRHESVKNTPKHLRIIYESCTNKGKFVAVLDNS